jgi:hypothetical protein
MLILHKLTHTYVKGLWREIFISFSQNSSLVSSLCRFASFSNGYNCESPGFILSVVLEGKSGFCFCYPVKKVIDFPVPSRPRIYNLIIPGQGEVGK